MIELYGAMCQHRIEGGDRIELLWRNRATLYTRTTSRRLATASAAASIDHVRHDAAAARCSSRRNAAAGVAAAAKSLARDA